MSTVSAISLTIFYVVVKFSFPLREEQAECVGEWEGRKMFVPKRGKVTGEWRKLPL
jgi:hypothetical protein